MWIITRKGFLSIVEVKGGVHDGRLLVRGRLKEDVQAALTGVGYRPKPIYTPEADYTWRAYIDRTDFSEWIMREIEDIHYPNFKAQVKKDGASEKRLALLHQVWAVLKGLNRRQQ